MHKIGVIGDKNSVQGFKAVGLEVFDCFSVVEAKQTLQKIANEDFAIIYITESLYKDMQNEVNEYNTKKLPTIIPIPGVEGSLGLGVLNIKKAVEKAVGADILFDNN